MKKTSLLRVVPFLFLILSIAACSGEEPIVGTHVWIDAPEDGLSILVGQEIPIEGHASGSEAITKVEVWIRGELYKTLEDLPMTGMICRNMTTSRGISTLQGMKS